MFLTGVIALLIGAMGNGTAADKEVLISGCYPKFTNGVRKCVTRYQDGTTDIWWEDEKGNEVQPPKESKE